MSEKNTKATETVEIDRAMGVVTDEIDPGMSVMPEGPGLMDVPTVIPELDSMLAEMSSALPAYQTTAWKNKPSTETPIDAAAMTRIEQRLVDLTNAVNRLRDSVSRSLKYVIDSPEKDLDKLVSLGVYSVKLPVNAPSGVTDWANLIVVPTNGSADYVAQILVTHAGVIYSRGRGGESWNTWKVIKRDVL